MEWINSIQNNDHRQVPKIKEFPACISTY